MKRFMMVVLTAVGIWAGEGWGQVDTVWTKLYGSARARPFCSSIMQVDNGDLVLSGSVYQRDIAGTRGWFLRVSENGDTLSSSVFGERSLNTFWGTLQTSGGAIVLAGSTESYGAIFSDVWIVQTDPNGVEEWNHHFGTNREDKCYSLCETADSSILLIGSATQPVDRTGLLMMKVAQNGDSLWSRLDYESIWDEGYCSVPLSEGGFAFAGRTRRGGGQDTDFLLSVIGPDGEDRWTRSFGGLGHDVCYDMLQLDDGGFLLAGETFSFGTGGSDFWLLKVTEEGDSLWSRTYGGNLDETRPSLVALYDGGIAIAGTTQSFGAGGEDIWLVRTDENGDSLWSFTFGGNSQDQCTDLIGSEDGGFIIGGNSSSFGGGSQAWLIKTTPDAMYIPQQPISIMPALFSLSSYPNPFNGVVNLSFQAARPGYYALEMVDPTGRSMGRLFEGYAGTGVKKMMWNAGGMAAGEYFVKVSERGGTDIVKPVVLLK